MNLNCDFIRIDGTIMPGVAGISVEHEMLRGVVRTLGGSLQVDRLGNAGVSNAWTVQFSGLSEQEKSFILFHVLSDSGVRRVAFFNTAGFDALVSVTRDEYVPRWDVTRTYRMHASGRLTLRVEALDLTSPFTVGGVYAEPMDGLLAFRSGVQVVPSTFTRASQAWDGSGLVAPDTMRVFGKDTKSPVVLVEGQRTNYVENSSLAGWDGTGAIPGTTLGGDVTLTPVPGPFPDVNGFRISTVGGGNDHPNSLTWWSFPDVSLGDKVQFTYWYRYVSGDGSLNIAVDPIAATAGGSNTGRQTTWTKFSYEHTATQEWTSRPMRMHLSDSSTVYEVAMFQVEQAPFPSSYIPTDGAPATRANEALYAQEIAVPPIGFTLNVGAINPLAGWGPSSSVRRSVEIRGTNDALVLLQIASSGRNQLLHSIGDSLTTVSGSVAEPRSVHSVVVSEDGSIFWFIDGELSRVEEDAYGRDYVWENLVIGYGFFGGNQFYGHVAPGAAALGIPVIDNRAWSAAEIQAAHARWLPELEKIEVPV